MAAEKGSEVSWTMAGGGVTSFKKGGGGVGGSVILHCIGGWALYWGGKITLGWELRRGGLGNGWGELACVGQEKMEALLL